MCHVRLPGEYRGTRDSSAHMCVGSTGVPFGRRGAKSFGTAFQGIRAGTSVNEFASKDICAAHAFENTRIRYTDHDPTRIRLNIYSAILAENVVERAPSWRRKGSGCGQNGQRFCGPPLSSSKQSRNASKRADNSSMQPTNGKCEHSNHGEERQIVEAVQFRSRVWDSFDAARSLRYSRGTCRP